MNNFFSSKEEKAKFQRTIDNMIMVALENAYQTEAKTIGVSDAMLKEFLNKHWKDNKWINARFKESEKLYSEAIGRLIKKKSISNGGSRRKPVYFLHRKFHFIKKQLHREDFTEKW